MSLLDAADEQTPPTPESEPTVTPTETAPAPAASTFNQNLFDTAKRAWKDQQAGQQNLGAQVLADMRPATRYLRVNLEDLTKFGGNPDLASTSKTGWMANAEIDGQQMPVDVMSLANTMRLSPASLTGAFSKGESVFAQDVDPGAGVLNVPMHDGDTPDEAIARAARRYQRVRGQQAQFEQTRNLDHFTLGAYSAALGKRPDLATFQQQHEDLAHESETRAFVNGWLMFDMTPVGAAFHGLLQLGKGAFTVGSRALLNTPLGRYAAAKVEAGVDRGVGYLHGTQPTGVLGWLGEKFGRSAATRVSAREAHQVENFVTRAGGDFFRVGDELRVYLPKWTPKADVERVKAALGAIKERIIGSPWGGPGGGTITGMNMKLVQGDLTVAQYAAKTFGIEAASRAYQMVGDVAAMSFAGAGTAAAFDAVPASLVGPGADRDALLADIPRAAAHGAAFGAVLGAVRPVGVMLADAGRTYPASPAAQKLLSGFTQGPAWETSLVPRPWAPYGTGSKAPSPAGAGPLPPTPTGIISPGLALRNTTIPPIRVPEPIRDAEEINEALASHVEAAQTAIRNATDQEAVQRAQALVGTAHGMVTKPYPDPTTGQPAPADARASAAAGLLSLTARVGPEKLSRLNTLLGYDLNTAVSSAGASPHAVEVLTAQAEWAAGLQDMLDSGLNQVLTGMDLPAVVGSEAGVPELAGGVARLKQVSEAILREQPGAAVGPPMRLRQLVPGLSSKNVAPVALTPPMDDRLPSEVTEAPTASDYQDNPRRAAQLTQQYLASRASNLEHPLGVIRYGKPSALSASEQAEIPVYSDTDGRTLLSVVNPSGSSAIGEGAVYDATIDGLASPDLKKTAGINAAAEPYFEPSPISPTVMRLDPETQRLVVDRAATKARDALRDYYKERARNPQVPLDPLNDTASLMDAIVSVQNMSPTTAETFTKKLDQKILAHRDQLPTYADARREAAPFDYEWEVARTYGDMIRQHAGEESLLEGLKLYIKEQMRPAPLDTSLPRLPQEEPVAPGDENWFPGLIPDPKPLVLMQEEIETVGQHIGNIDQAIEITGNQVSGDPSHLIKGIVKEQGIQNGMDAARLRKKLDGKVGKVDIIMVEETGATEDGRRYHIAIRDTGIGMSPETIKEAYLGVFSSFGKEGGDETGGGFGVANTPALLFMEQMELVSVTPKQDRITGVSRADVQNQMGEMLRKNSNAIVLLEPYERQDGQWHGVVMDRVKRTKTRLTGTAQDYRKGTMKLEKGLAVEDGAEPGTEILFMLPNPKKHPRLKQHAYTDLGFRSGQDIIKQFAAYNMTGVEVTGYSDYVYTANDSEFTLEKFRNESLSPRTSGKIVSDKGIAATTKIGSIDTEAYSADVYVPNAIKSIYSITTHVLSNGAIQFTQDIKALGSQPGDTFAGPPYAVMNVRSKVPPTDSRYPFSINRSSLQDSAKEELQRFLQTTVLKAAHTVHLKGLREALEPNPALPVFASGRGFHDPLNIVSPEWMNALLEIPGINELEQLTATFVEDIRETFEEMFVPANFTPDGTFDNYELDYLGFGVPQNALGVNYRLKQIYKDEGRAKSGIVLNVNALARIAMNEYELLSEKGQLPADFADAEDLAERFGWWLQETAVHEVGHMIADSEAKLAQVVDVLNRLAHKAGHTEKFVSAVRDLAKENGASMVHSLESLFGSYRSSLDEHKKENPLEGFIWGGSPGSYSNPGLQAEAFEALGLLNRRDDGSDTPDVGGDGSRRQDPTDRPASPGPEGSEQRDDLRAEALAHLALGESWSSTRGSRLFNALTSGQKFEAMMARIASGKFKNRRHLDLLEPNGWVKRNKFPKYFRKWRPNASMIRTLQTMWEQAKLIWLVERAALGKSLTRAQRAHEARKNGSRKPPANLPKYTPEELRAISRMSEDTVFELAKKSPRAYDDLVRAVMKQGSEATDEQDLDTMKLIEDVMPLIRRVGQRRTEEGLHPSDVDTDPLTSYDKVKEKANRLADLSRRSRDFVAKMTRSLSVNTATSKNLRMLARPYRVIGPARQYPTPQLLRQAAQDGVFERSPWYDTATGDYLMRKGIRDFMEEFDVLMNAAFIDKALDKKLFAAGREFGEATPFVMQELERPEWNDFKVPVTKLKTETINIKDWFPKWRRRMNEIIRQAEPAKLFMLNAEAGTIRVNARALEAEKRHRELEAAQQVNKEITNWHDIPRVLGKQFLPHARKRLMRSPDGARDQKRTVFYRGVEGGAITRMPYKELQRQHKQELAALRDKRDMIRGIKDGSLRRYGYITYLGMLADEAQIARDMRDPRSVVYQSTSPEVRARFLEARTGEKEPVHSFANAMMVYIPSIMRLIHLQPAVTRALGQLPTMTSAERVYTIKWLERMRAIENPTDAMLNTATYEALMEEPGLLPGLMEAISGSDKSAKDIIKQSKATGHIQPSTASRFIRMIGAIAYITVMDITRVGQLSLSEFAFTMEPVAKGGVKDLTMMLPRAAGAMATGAGAGIREMASWVKNAAVGGGRYYSEATRAQVVDIVHEHAEINPVSGLAHSRGKGGNVAPLGSLMDRVTQLYFAPIKGAEFWLRASTYYLMKQRLLAAGFGRPGQTLWKPGVTTHTMQQNEYGTYELPASSAFIGNKFTDESDELMFWASELTNDLIGAYGGRTTSPLAGNAFFLWWAAFKRFAMAKTELLATDLGAARQTSLALLEKAAMGKLPPMSQQELQPGDQGIKPPRPPLDRFADFEGFEDESMGPDDDPGRYASDADERDTYNQTYAAEAASIGSSRPMSNKATAAHLRGLMAWPAAILAAYWLFALSRDGFETLGVDDDPLASSFNTMNPFNFTTGSFVVGQIVDDFKDYYLLRAKGETFGLDLAEGQKLDRLALKLQHWMPYMRAFMDTFNLGSGNRIKEQREQMEQDSEAGVFTERQMAERRRLMIENEDLARPPLEYQAGGPMHDPSLKPSEIPDARYPGRLPEWIKNILPDLESDE